MFLSLRIVYKRQLFKPFLVKIVLIIHIRCFNINVVFGGLTLDRKLIVIHIFGLEGFLRLENLRFNMKVSVIRFLLLDNTMRLRNISLRL